MALSEGDEVVFRMKFSKGDTVIDVGETGVIKRISRYDWSLGNMQSTTVTYFVIAKRMLWMCYPGEIAKKVELSAAAGE
jgi:hypothetical protein